MAQDLSGAARESRPLRQRPTLLIWRALRCSREVFQTHHVVYQRGGVVLTMTATSSPPKTSFPARLPQSVTSLTIRAGNSGVDLMQMQDIMAGLLNLNGLIVSGPFIARSKSKKLLSGSWAVLRGRFGGGLQIRNGYTDEYIVDMLLETPIRLHFTKLQVYAGHACRR